MPSFADTAARLARDPFRLTPDQVGELTDWQIINVYFRALDGKGGRADDRPDCGLSNWEIFRNVWVDRGLTVAECVKKWKADYPGDEGYRTEPGFGGA